MSAKSWNAWGTGGWLLTIVFKRRSLASHLRPGGYVEVQWKARIDHPFGWWLGQIREVSSGCVMVEFVQYPDTSLWRCLEIPFCSRKPSVAISSGCILG